MNAQHHHGWKLKGIFLLAVPSGCVRLAYPAIVLAVWSFSQDLLWPGMLQAALLNVNAHCINFFGGRCINLRMFSFCFTLKTHLFKSLFRAGPFVWNERVVLGILLCSTDSSLSDDRKFSPSCPWICSCNPSSSTGSEHTSDSQMPVAVYKQQVDKDMR